MVLTLLIGVRAAIPPKVVSASAPPAVFSAARAAADIRAIALRPHPTASADILRVRSYLAGRLRSLGLQPEERRYLIDPQGFATLHRWNPLASPASELVDLVAVLPGKDRLKPAVALMAHMDTVWGSPGSADDSVGVAAILETLRAIKARGVPERDVVVLLTDGEEIGLSGARAFWPADGLADHVGVVINLEARGAGGRATMFETGDGNGDMIASFGRSVHHPVGNSMAVMAYRLMPNSTDFTPVRDRGLAGFNFAIMGGASYYHSPRATIDRLDPRSMQDLGDQVLDLASGLAFATKLPVEAADVTFFDVLGRGFIHYPPATGWLVILAGVGALAAACAGLRRRKRPVFGEAAAGAVAFVWLAAHGLLALLLFNLISGSAAHPNYYDRLAALPRLEAQAALACGGVLLGWLMLRRPPRRVLGLIPAAALLLLDWSFGGPHGLILVAALVAMLVAWFAPVSGATRWGGWIGALAVLLAFATILQVKAPMAAWIIAWPTLILAIAAASLAWLDPPFAKPWSWAIAAVAAVVAIAPLVPLAHLAFLGIGASMPEAMLPFLLLVAAALWPMARIGRVHRRALAAVAIPLVMALAIAVHVRTDPIADTIPAYSLDK